MKSLRKAIWLLSLGLFSFSLASAQSPEYYKNRRGEILSRLINAAALIPSAWEGELESFRQSNNFFYLTGIEQPDLLLLLAPSARSPETLFLPARNLEEGSMSEAWTGAKLGPGKGAEEQTGIAKTAAKNTFDFTFANLAGGLDKLYFDYTPGPLEGPVSAGEVFLRALRDKYPHLQILPFSRLVDSLRTVKDSSEIRTLQQAVDITGASLRETIPQVRPGMFEYEVEALIEYGFARRGSQRPGFPSIVGSGPNTTVLHYDKNRRKIGAGELVLMDVGAEFDYYTADITRTVPADGRFTDRQREIYQLVLEAQKAGFKAVRPGVTLKEVHQAAKNVIDSAGYGQYFIHYTSHFLGMDVHDVGSREIPLSPGMIITVEPGIYLPAESLGVRLEDDVLVTEDGCRVMSASIPKEVREIEALMQSK